MRRRALTARVRNFVPDAYRQVSVQSYAGALTEAAIGESLLGREAYRTTRFIVLDQAPDYALVEVAREDTTALFSPIRQIGTVVLPDRCRFIEDPRLDTGNPSALADRARALGLGAGDTLLARGRDSHVNFIYRPDPARVRIFDVVPPEPSKLARVADEVLAFAEMPATRLDATVVDLRQRARRAEAPESFLVPCRASGLGFDLPTHFLDERPERRQWTLLGCERSRQIHRHFYGDTPRFVETCPRRLLAEDETPTLLRCCLLEDHVELERHRAIVPWGATLRAVGEALRHLVRTIHRGSS